MLTNALSCNDTVHVVAHYSLIVLSMGVVLALFTEI